MIQGSCESFADSSLSPATPPTPWVEHRSVTSAGLSPVLQCLFKFGDLPQVTSVLRWGPCQIHTVHRGHYGFYHPIHTPHVRKEPQGSECSPSGWLLTGGSQIPTCSVPGKPLPFELSCAHTAGTTCGGKGGGEMVNSVDSCLSKIQI